MEACFWTVKEVVVPVAGLRAWVTGAEGCVVGASWARDVRSGRGREGPALRLVTVCAKGNGKRKEDEEKPTARPPRITPLTASAYGGVRNYIKLVRQQRQQEAAGRTSIPGARVAFRRTRKTQEQISEEKRSDAEDRSDQQTSLGSLSGTLTDRKPPVLLVDGYNVLYRMVVQNRKKLERLDLESQRQVLEEDILIFSQHRGVKVKIVYDAAGRQTGENEICCEKKSGIDLVFCTTVEADIGLMIEAAQSLLEGAPYVMIATSDRAAQLDCTGPKTRVISSELLLKEIKDCKKRLRAKLLESQTQYARGRLAGAMNSDSDIKKLRDQLLQT